MEAVESVGIGSTPNEAIEQIERFRRAGVNELMVTPVASEFVTAVRMYGKHIIPYFNES